MADLNPIGYPYLVTTTQGSYTLSVDGSVIYSGKAYPFPDQTSVSVDISDILRGYISYYDYTGVFSGAETKITSGIVHNVQFNSGDELKFYWCYNYWYETLSNEDNLCNYITPTIYMNQWIPMSAYTTDANTYRMYVGTTSYVTLASSDTNPNVVFAARRMTTSSYDGKTVKVTTPSGTNIVLGDVIGCVPDNVMTLYYINMHGALDFVHMTGSNVVKGNVTRNQLTHESQINMPTKAGIANYQIDSYNTYTLNTGIFNDTQSEKFQEVLKSPALWLQDYKHNTVKAVVITDTNMTVKTRRKDHVFNYTLNVKDSQTYSIKA